MKAEDGGAGLISGMSKKEEEAFQLDLIESVRTFKCGTPFINELIRAADAFHAGKPVSPLVAVDEVILIVHDDWKETGNIMYPEGTGGPIYTPRVDVEGGEENILMIFKEDIEGFVPERGHSYKLRVRRFRIIREPSFNQYELLERLSDKSTID